MRLFHSEIKKHKNTLALFFVFFGPFLIVLLMAIQTVLQGAGFLDQMTPARFFVQNNLTLWSFLMLPFFVTLITALSAYLEHKNRVWHVLLTAGVGSSKLFLVKIAFTFALVALSYLFWFVCILLGSLLLEASMPSFGQWTAADTEYVIARLGVMSVLTLPMVVIHFWVANRWKNILIAFGFGVVITIVNFLIASSTLRDFFPWSLPLLASRPAGLSNPFVTYAFVVIITVMLTVIIVVDLTKKEM